LDERLANLREEHANSTGHAPLYQKIYDDESGGNVLKFRQPVKELKLDQAPVSHLVLSLALKAGRCQNILPAIHFT
jgi:hypothetical protein